MIVGSLRWKDPNNVNARSSSRKPSPAHTAGRLFAGLHNRGLTKSGSPRALPVGVGARGVNPAGTPTRRAENRTPKVEVAVLGALPLAMSLLVHSALMIVSGEFNSRSERHKPVA